MSGKDSPEGADGHAAAPSPAPPTLGRATSTKRRVVSGIVAVVVLATATVAIVQARDYLFADLADVPVGVSAPPSPSPTPTPTPSPTPSPTPTQPTHRTDPPFEDFGDLSNAQVFAQLYIPRFATPTAGDETWMAGRPIAQGIGNTVLDTIGLGHYDTSGLPGQIGNFAVAGHRTSHSRPLFAADTLVAGDALIVESAENWYVYLVTSTQVVRPSDVWVIAPIPEPRNNGAEPTQSLITLTTCTPLYTTQQRLIVWGSLEYWMPKSDGTPPELSSPVNS